ncbi:hypothetical protein ACFWUQ_00405 [Streptomyces sp. NPDC058662]|uniref:hypothetical protein n=1 Tax=Streptomyces sp. NPDC058662 TaxID=3346583 RepID=UPI003656F03B
MGRVRRNVRTAAAATGAAALLLAAHPPGAAWAAPAAPEPVPSYRAADGAKQVRGGSSTADAPPLEVGGLHADTVSSGDRYYRLVLRKDGSNVYVSAVARPGADARVSHSDGIAVQVMTTEGRACPGNPGRADFGYDPVPISAVGIRWGAEDAVCAPAGVYYVKVTRTSAAGSDQRPWPLELRVQREPAHGPGTPTSAPSGRPSEAPVLPGTEPAGRAGGTGFNDARALGAGVFRDGLRPGQTRFYRVPLDWGQQLGVGAELAAARMTKASGSAAGGLSVSLYNPYRQLVAAKDASYDGEQAGVTLGRTVAVAYGNRYASERTVHSVALAGWYYLAVTMGGKVGEFTEDAQPVPLTLRVDLAGGAVAAPAYQEGLAAGGFGVGAADRAAAREGLTAPEAADAAENRSAMRVVAAAGFGTGTLLLAGLGGWILRARRGRPRPVTSG